jgi:hypothetical protein
MSEIYNDADYIELTIKCLFRDKQTLSKALDLQVRPEDFGTINIYNAFVETALSIGDAPVNPQLCLAEIKARLKKHNILQADMPTILTFWEYIYNDAPLSADYVLSNLADFVKFRRYQSLKVSSIHNPEELVSEANKLIGDIDLKNTTGGIREFNPFEDLVTIEHRESLMTGFPAIDAVAKADARAAARCDTHCSWHAAACTRGGDQATSSVRLSGKLRCGILSAVSGLGGDANSEAKAG